VIDEQTVQLIYAAWRLDYYIAARNLTYQEIDAMVDRGEILPWTMPNGDQWKPAKKARKG